jgi:purine-binding chemotaxis protein CheW
MTVTEDGIEMCSVRVGDTLFGMPITRILEILDKPATRPVPLAPAHIGGLVHYRGEILTAVSLRSLLGLPGHSKPPDMLVFEGRDGYFGLLVDAVGEVLTVSPQELRAEPFNTRRREAGALRGHLQAERLSAGHAGSGQVRPAVAIPDAAISIGRHDVLAYA